MNKTVLRFPGWLWAVALFALTFVPRASAFARYVTPDEPNWIYRTLNFGAALARGDWAGTVQAGHPGVTTMWLGSVGVALGRAFEPAAENIEALKRIGVFLDWARLPVVLVNALGVAGLFLLARRLLGQRAALLAGLLFALDPFAAGLGGLLHVDGLLATFAALSILALLNAISPVADGRHMRHAARSAVQVWPMAPPPPASAHSSFLIQHSAFIWFALSGAFAGLATLSKSPALFLIPFTLLVLVAAVLARRLSIRDALTGLAIFLILHSSFFILLYPAMWSDPSTALDVILERAAHHAVTATRPTFFDGQAELNHGPGFYPVALAFRLSPVVIAGLVPAAFYLLARLRQPRADPTSPENHARFAIFTLLLFALLFVAVLSPAAKKFDRYLLPVVPPLILAAAWGVDRLTHPQTGFVWRTLSPSAVALQALFIVSVAPYPLMAYNPLLGGAAGARDRIAVGWGEGFAAAAAWVAEHDPGAVIATGGLSNVVPLVDGRTVTIDTAGLAAADYIVFTVSEMQLAPDFFRELARQGTLAQPMPIAGIDAAWVYRTANPLAQAQWIGSRLQSNDAVVLDAPTPLASLLPPSSLVVLPLDATPELVSSALQELRDRSRILHVSTPAASAVVRRNVRDWLEANGRLVEEANVAGAAIRVYQPAGTARALESYLVQFDGALALVGLEPVVDSAAYPDSIALAARWRVLSRPTAHYSVTLELTDALGDGWTKFSEPLRDARDFKPIDWQPGEVAEQVLSLQVPPYLAPGTYRVRFSIDTPDGRRAALVSARGAFSGTAPLLATVRVDPALPRHEPDVVAARQPVGHVWPGAAELLSMDLLTYVVATGDPFLATLHWRSLREGLNPATELRWALEPESVSDDPARSFEWDTLLAPNANRPMRYDDVFSARYALRLPLDLPDGRYRLRLTLEGEALDIAPIDVWHRDRNFDRPADASRAGEVGAFDLYLIDSLPSQAQPGESFEVKLALQARQEVAVDYTLFVHLVDAAERVVAQVDTWPQGGFWPTANWVQGQVVDDALTLTLPGDAAPGAYRVVAGMYDALDGSRLPARDAQGRAAPDGRLLLGAPIEVTAP
jgi:4-amino-4-deoxy-L-arabinose transferase-like glycosyltransferase